MLHQSWSTGWNENKFSEATISFQDDVYTRTCDIQSVSAVFGANLYCHNLCIKSYLLNYERIFEKGQTEKPETHKQQAWEQVVKDIEMGINQGFGYELSFARDYVNREITSCKRVTTHSTHFIFVVVVSLFLLCFCFLFFVVFFVCFFCCVGYFFGGSCVLFCFFLFFFICLFVRWEGGSGIGRCQKVAQRHVIYVPSVKNQYKRVVFGYMVIY